MQLHFLKFCVVIVSRPESLSVDDEVSNKPKNSKTMNFKALDVNYF